jgi:glycosyltransferase involved in cell wall biosynthesis
MAALSVITGCHEHRGTWTHRATADQVVTAPGQRHCDPGRTLAESAKRVEHPTCSASSCGLIHPAAVHRMYQTVDAFVLPSFEEPYGTVWGEAMAAGLPVVGWQAGNLPFLADHGRDGMLVPVGDVLALGGAIEGLARDPALRERLGRAAQVRASARPTWDETAARFSHHPEVRQGTKKPATRPGR